MVQGPNQLIEREHGDLQIHCQIITGRRLIRLSDCKQVTGPQETAGRMKTRRGRNRQKQARRWLESYHHVRHVVLSQVHLPDFWQSRKCQNKSTSKYKKTKKKQIKPGFRADSNWMLRSRYFGVIFSANILWIV